MAESSSLTTQSFTGSFPGFDLGGRCALVTGSSRGIGRAIAERLGQAGADVVIHTDHDEAPAEQAAGVIRGFGRRSAVLRIPLGPTDAARQVFAGAVAALGRVDILVSGVAVDIPQPWREVDEASIDRQFAINYRSAFQLIQLAAAGMAERGWGRILTIGSVQEAKPHPNMCVYASLKSAQAALVQNLARQLASSGVTINNLSPGVILTDRNTDRLADETYRRAVLDKIPAARFGLPVDCGGPALLLCSDAGGYVTGQTLFVDGGMSL